MAVRFRKAVDNSAERLICIGLIVSDYIIGQLQPIIHKDIWTTTYSKRVADWCLAYYEQHGKAPKQHIKHIFEEAKRIELDSDDAELIEALLSSLNAQVIDGDDSFNSEYIIAEAEKYIKARSLQITCEDALALLSRNQVVEAEGKIAQYSIPQRPNAEGVDVFSDDFWDVQDDEAQVLFRLKGGLGDLIGPIERDSLISILATEKKGKSWYLLDFALAAYTQRRNVVFFSLGDMTQPQMRRRIRHMITYKDPKRPKEKYVIPVLDCLHNQKGECPFDEPTDSIYVNEGKSETPLTYEDKPDHQVCIKCIKDKKRKRDFCGAVWYEEKKLDDVCLNINSARNRILQKAGSRRFRLFCYPPHTATVSTIISQLDILQQQENFIPDLIVLDYADLLAPDTAALKLDYRNQINHSWMGLRALAQVRNCCVLTATQAKQEAQRNAQVNQWDTSEDKRKLAHVTAMLALNQTPQEKRAGIMRISNLAMRDSDFDVNQNAVVLQCLGIGKPYIASYLERPSNK